MYNLQFIIIELLLCIIKPRKIFPQLRCERRHIGAALSYKLTPENVCNVFLWVCDKVKVEYVVLLEIRIRYICQIGDQGKIIFTLDYMDTDSVS